MSVSTTASCILRVTADRLEEHGEEELSRMMRQLAEHGFIRRRRPYSFTSNDYYHSSWTIPTEQESDIRSARRSLS